MQGTDNRITLAIVDDHPVVIEGLRALLEKRENIRIAGCFTNGSEMLGFLRNQAVDVILLDISLPDMHGADLCEEIKRRYPFICVLAISNHNERSIIMQMLQNGASGYVLKNASAEELTGAILDAISGKLALSEEIQSILARDTAPLRQTPRLTRREKEVLKLVAEGYTSPQIAEALSISPLTVETHRRNLMQKLEVGNSASLIRAAVEQRLI